MQSRRHLCFGLLYLACLPVARAAPKPDDAMVLVAYLNEIAHKPIDFKSIVVAVDSLDLSTSPSRLRSGESIQRELPEVSRSAAHDFVAQSKTTKSVVIPLGALDLSIRVQQPLASEVRAVFETEESLDRQWENFRDKFSGAKAIVRFSRVGYSADSNQAVFVLSVACGGLCGSGVIVLMQRTQTGWRILKESRLWVS